MPGRGPGVTFLNILSLFTKQNILTSRLQQTNRGLLTTLSGRRRGTEIGGFFFAPLKLADGCFDLIDRELRKAVPGPHFEHKKAAVGSEVASKTSLKIGPVPVAHMLGGDRGAFGANSGGGSVCHWFSSG